MTILGIDPGLASTGMCFLDGCASRCWTVRTSTRESTGARIEKIGLALSEYIGLRHVSLVAIEDYRWQGHARSANRNIGTLKEVIGVLKGVAMSRGFPVEVLSRNEVLLGLTGKSNAPKAVVEAALKYRKLDYGRNEHERDALAVAYVAGRKREVAHMLAPFGGMRNERKG